MLYILETIYNGYAFYISFFISVINHNNFHFEISNSDYWLLDYNVLLLLYAVGIYWLGMLRLLILVICCDRMIPHKTKRGEAALARLKVYEGVPPPYDKTKKMVIPDALKWVWFDQTTFIIIFWLRMFNILHCFPICWEQGFEAASWSQVLFIGQTFFRSRMEPLWYHQGKLNACLIFCKDMDYHFT